ncbi:TPA: hypothetical protein ACWLXL_004398 [Pseudomonas aeruginosa]
MRTSKRVKEEGDTLNSKVNVVSNDRLPLNRNIVVCSDGRAYQCVKGNVGLAFPGVMNAGEASVKRPQRGWVN